MHFHAHDEFIPGVGLGCCGKHGDPPQKIQAMKANALQWVATETAIASFILERTTGSSTADN